MQEVLAGDAVALGQPHQPAFVADQPLVDVVELLDQRIDARLIEPQRLHLLDDLFLELLRLALLRRRQRLVLELVLDVEFLQAAQPLERVGDVVEGLEHLRLELGLDGGERHRIFEIVLVHLGFADGGLERASSPSRAGAGCGLNGVAAGGADGGATACGGCAQSRARRMPRRSSAAGSPGGARRRHVLGVGTGIGRFEIDDVAEEDFAFVEFVAPDDDGLERQRALAQAGDHRLAAGLDALGDGDFALARQQLDRAHFAQIHPHRIVGALGRLLGFGLGRRLRRDLDQFAALGLLLLGLLAGALFLVGLGFLGLDDVDAHLAHHRQHVLDLLGGDFLGRHDRVELFIGDVAALLGLLDHLLDGGVGEIEQRQRCIRGFGAVLLRRLAFLWRGRLLRRDLGLARDRLGGHALDHHFCLHERLSLPPRGTASSLPYGAVHALGDSVPCRAPTLGHCPPWCRRAALSGRRVTPKARTTAKKGSA